jgi:hypothetical protein
MRRSTCSRRAVSYETAVEGIGELLRKRHPELNDDAVKAFMNAFAYDWNR